MAEHLTVNEAVAGSTPVDPPTSGAVAERRMHFAVDEDDDGSSPFGPANFMDVWLRQISIGLKIRRAWRDTRSVHQFCQNRLRKRAANSPKEAIPMFAFKSRIITAT